MKHIKIAAIALMSGLFILQTASAATLNISNSTKSVLAFTVNGVCSSEIGKVSANFVKTVSEADFKKACGKDEECLVQAYKNACYTDYVGGVVYNEKKSSVFVDGGDGSCISTTASVKQGELNLLYMECVNKK